MDQKVLNRLKHTFAIAIVIIGVQEACAQTGPGVVPQGAFILQRVANASGGVSNTGNGDFADDGIGHAVAIYTGNDGMVSASIMPGSDGVEEVYAEVSWAFTILAPEDRAQIPVPVIMTGLGRVTVQGATEGNIFQADASFSGPFSSLDVSLNDNGDAPFVINSSGVLLPFQVYSIYMQLTEFKITGFYGNDDPIFGGTTLSIDEMIDPFVEFAPGFDSDGYTIVSSDVPPLASQPEPAQIPEPPMSTIVAFGSFVMLAVSRRRSKLNGRRGDTRKREFLAQVQRVAF